MQRRWTTLALILAAAAVSKPALACQFPIDRDPKSVKYADVVVIGRISNYRIVLDQGAREARKKMLSDPSISPKLRKLLGNTTSFVSDYARFDLIVDGVLRGRAPKKISATWNNSTFGEPPSIPSGSYLVALLNKSSRSPTPRTPNVTRLASVEAESWQVLQAPCSSPFIIQSASAEATALRKILRAQPN